MYCKRVLIAFLQIPQPRLNHPAPQATHQRPLPLLLDLRQRFLQGLVPGATHAIAHRGAALQVRTLWQRVQPEHHGQGARGQVRRQQHGRHQGQRLRERRF